MWAPDPPVQPGRSDAYNVGLGGLQHLPIVRIGTRHTQPRRRFLPTLCRRVSQGDNLGPLDAHERRVQAVTIAPPPGRTDHGDAVLPFLARYQVLVLANHGAPHQRDGRAAQLQKLSSPCTMHDVSLLTLSGRTACQGGLESTSCRDKGDQVKDILSRGGAEQTFRHD